MISRRSPGITGVGSGRRRRHAAPLPRIRRRRVAAVTVAGLLATSLGVPAVAAEAENPWTTATITLQSDGTGHGVQGAQTFIRSENGFAPGDNSPTDGVVSSGDSVTYVVQLAFQASMARTVAVTIGVPSSLE